MRYYLHGGRLAAVEKVATNGAFPPSSARGLCALAFRLELANSPQHSTGARAHFVIGAALRPFLRYGHTTSAPVGKATPPLVLKLLPAGRMEYTITVQAPFLRQPVVLRHVIEGNE